MIERDDMTTAQRPTGDAMESEPESTATNPAKTIQVPPVSPAASPAPAASIATTATASALPYMSVDDLLALRIAGDPQVSPDGSLIAFTLQQSHAETNRTSSAIWLASTRGAKGEAPRQLTNPGESYHDTQPRWSPDGQTLAFISDRSGMPQIHLLSLQGGEAWQVSTLAQGVVAYCWRPDGSALLAQGYWKPADDQNLPGTSATSMVYTRLDEQADGLGYKQHRHQQLWLVPLSGGATRLTSDPVDHLSACWSPDGSEVAFCANRQEDPDLSESLALWVLTLATGQTRRLTPETGQAQAPSWSPDGQTIAYLYAPDLTEASNYSPWITSAHRTGAPRPAASTTSNFTCMQLLVDELHYISLEPPHWYPDSASLLIPVQERGQLHLYRVDTENDQIIQLTSGNGCYFSPRLSQNGQTIAAIRADWFTPGDVWIMDGDGMNRRKLSGVNDAFLRSRQLIRPKRVTWNSFDGLEIEGWLYLPATATGEKLPLILEVHGGPTLAWGDSYVHEFQALAGRGYAVLAANPRGSSGYGEEFTRKVVNDWGGDDFRDLMAGLDHVIASEPVDEQRLGIGGLSYGGYMTNWAITQTNRFKAAVSRNGISSISSESLLSDQATWFDVAMRGQSGGQDSDTFRRSRSALTFADRVTTPLLLLHADNDLRCPFSESMQFFAALRKRKHPVELVRYPGTSHLLDWPDVGTPAQRVDRLRRTLAWFQAHL
jgi:dipeptidyl aminopeptidase/acylaminoacyl peptidase